MWAWAQQWQTWVIALLLLLLLWSAWLTWQQLQQLWRLLWQPFHVGKVYKAKVVEVCDGNRLRCRRRFRRAAAMMPLAYSHAPNQRQAHGKAAKLALHKASAGQTLQLWIVGEDEYSLHIEAYVRGHSLCERLISKGHARAATTYARDQEERRYLLNLQQAAQQKKLGMWKETNSTAAKNSATSKRQTASKTPTRKTSTAKKSSAKDQSNLSRKPRAPSRKTSLSANTRASKDKARLSPKARTTGGKAAPRKTDKRLLKSQ